MAKLGVIYNPNSGGGKNALHSRIAGAKEAANIVFVETTSKADIVPALTRIAARGANHLAIIGGDGTVDAVLTELRRKSPFETEPLIAVLDGGTTNMSYMDIGYKLSKQSPRNADPLLDILKAVEANKAKTVTRSPIEVSSRSLKAPLLGFFFGSVAIPRAINHTRSAYHTKGMTNTIGQALATTGMLWRLVRGNVKQDPILTPARTIIEHDGTTRTADTVFLTLTSLRTLLLGIRPLKTGDGGMALMGVTAPYSRFLRHLPTLLTGSRSLEPQTDHGCLNIRTDACTLAFDGEWTLDGELFKATADAPINISTVSPFTFVVGAK